MDDIDNMFQHEKQNAYLLALKFICWKTALFDDCTDPRNETKDIFDLLDKGGLSILFYTLEGNEKTSLEEKQILFSKAIIAAKESSSCLDVLVANKGFEKTRINSGKKILIGIVALLEDRKSRFKGLISSL